MMKRSLRKKFKSSLNNALSLTKRWSCNSKKYFVIAAICPILASMMSCSGNCAEGACSSEVECDQMRAIECIMTRSSIRSWSEEKISRDTIEIILKAAMASPTAVNRQPWAFVVVESGQARAALAEAVEFKAPKEVDADGPARPGRPNFVTEAPVTIVVCGNRDKFLDGEAAGFWVEDTSAATENLLLAAHAMGLGAVWCGIYPLQDRVESVTKALDLPQNLIPMCYVPVGYPNVEPNIKDKWDPQNVMWK